MTQPERAAAGRRPRPHPMSVEEAQRIYEAHVPSMVTHVCMACFGDERWPCRPYQDAKGTLLRAGRLQNGPVQPCV